MSALEDALAAHKAKPMTEVQAEALGRQAVAQGKPNLPFTIPALAAEMEGAQPGEKTHLLRAFNRGWHAAFDANWEMMS